MATEGESHERERFHATFYPSYAFSGQEDASMDFEFDTPDGQVDSGMDYEFDASNGQDDSGMDYEFTSQSSAPTIDFQVPLEAINNGCMDWQPTLMEFQDGNTIWFVDPIPKYMHDSDAKVTATNTLFLNL